MYHKAMSSAQGMVVTHAGAYRNHVWLVCDMVFSDLHVSACKHCHCGCYARVADSTSVLSAPALPDRVDDGTSAAVHLQDLR
jgi:hypothetical protein